MTRTLRTAPAIGSLIPSQRGSRKQADEETRARLLAEGADLTHDWVGAATVKLDEREARYANFRQSFRTKEAGLRIDVLDVYCSDCRRPFDDVADEDCTAKINNEHLIGGDQSERAKRKAPAPLGAGQTLVPGVTVNRRGIEAFVRGEV